MRKSAIGAMVAVLVLAVAMVGGLLPRSAKADRSATPVGWVAGGEIGALFLYRDDIRRDVLEAQRRARFNTLFVTVKQFDGRLWYYSPSHPKLMATPSPLIRYTPSDNPLMKVLDEARTGRPRQAVMVLFQAFQDRHAAWDLFPEARIGNLNWVDPAYKPMQDYLIALGRELVTLYPVDGISLDFVRYPSGVSNARLPITQNRSRVDVITDFVDRFARAIHAIDPTVDVSVNAFPEAIKGAGGAIGQDVARRRTVCDFILPMFYPYDEGTPQDGADERTARYQYQLVNTRSAVARAGDPELIKPNVQGFFGYTLEDVIAQIRGVRAGGGTGTLVYAYDFELGWDPDQWARLAEEMPESGSTRRFRADGRPPVISKAGVQEATVLWETDELTRGSVIVYPPSAPSWEVQADGWGRSPQVFVPGLVPGVQYTYRIRATDVQGNVTLTAPQPLVFSGPSGPKPEIQDVAVLERNDVWAVIAWETNVPTRGSVEVYDGAASETSTASTTSTRRIGSGTFGRTHRVRLTGLTGGKAYRYRISATTGDGREAAGLYALATPIDVAQGARVTASSVIHKGFEAHRVVDGRMDTRWSSIYADDQWIQLDLGTERTISAVGLEWEYAYAAKYRLQVSVDGKRWHQVYETSSGNGGREDIAFPPARARYVRLLMDMRGTGLGNSLWEFKVFE